MAEQFSQTVAGLIKSASPKLELPSSPPSSPKQPTTFAPPSPSIAMPYSDTNQTPNQTATPTQNSSVSPSPDQDVNVSGKILLFSTSTNAFSYRTLSSPSTLSSVILTSPRYRISSMKIELFALKVDLRDAGVKMMEGQVDELIKDLPVKVVVLRMLGWYKILWVVRHFEDAVGGREEEMEGMVLGEVVGDTEGLGGVELVEGVDSTKHGEIIDDVKSVGE